MLSKMISNATRRAARSAEVPNQFDLLAASRISSANIPRAPKTAFRKRPVKLEYDQNEYLNFRLPSEDAQLLNTFEKEDIFGKY